MRTNLSAMLLLSVIVCMSSVVFAQDAANLSEAEKREISVFNYQYGAEVRLLELQKNIAKNILEGSKIMGILNQTYPGKNLTKMEAILDELSGLLDEAKMISSIQNKTQIAGDFVAVKRDALNLTWRFRQESEPLLNRSIRRDIRHELANTTFTPINKADAELKNLRNLYNQKRVEGLLNGLNMTDAALLEKIGSGEYASFQIRGRLEKDLENLEEKDRERTAEQLSELISINNQASEELTAEADRYYLERINVRKTVKQLLRERELELAKSSRQESYGDRLVEVRTKLDTKTQETGKSAGNGSEEGK